MAVVGLDPAAPFCCRCAVHHWPDTRHYGRVRRLVARVFGRGRRD